jgi:glycosyltransferase involved in cell wall biosynthesis
MNRPLSSGDTARMRIAFDSQIFDLQRHGGISRYFLELRTALVASGAVDARVVRKIKRRRLGSYYGNLLAAKLAQADVWHSTYYDERYLWALRGRRHVVTIHDMLPERFPDQFPNGNPHLAKAQYVQQADAVIAVSAYTAREVAEFYDVSSTSVTVVHEAAAPIFSTRPASRPSLPPYLLYVGARAGYKSFETLATAFSTLKSDLHLVLVGGAPLSANERALLGDPGPGGRLHHVYPSDSELLSFYAHAVALVVTSIAEGFGLPLVEAMAAGCPIISSRGGALPEVADDAALYFEPGDNDDLAGNIDRVAADRQLRSALVRAGSSRSPEFSWAKAALAMTAVYRSVVTHRG